MTDIVFDITELVQNPITTGIQRVVRELIRYWPEPDRLRLARFDPAQGLLPLSPNITPLLVDNEGVFADAKPGDIAAAINKHLADPVVPLPKDPIIFVPELFFDPVRCAWYLQQLNRDPQSVAFLLYDFIPWLFPHRIGVTHTAPLMPYLQLVRSASRVSFISSLTRQHYFDRICRQPGEGPVLPLGSDGLGMARQSFDAGKHTWVSVGSIDGRKNQARIVKAFCQLWERGFEGELVVIGRVFDRAGDEWRQLQVDDPRYQHIADATDDEIKAELTGARATIYVSDIEGFGLPPVESLHAGIPVIVTQSVPSIQDLDDRGQVRIDSASVENIARAIECLSDDENARELWKQASSISLPTWKSFSKTAFEWIRSWN